MLNGFPDANAGYFTSFRRMCGIAISRRFLTRWQFASIRFNRVFIRFNPVFIRFNPVFIRFAIMFYGRCFQNRFPPGFARCFNFFESIVQHMDGMAWSRSPAQMAKGSVLTEQQDKARSGQPTHMANPHACSLHPGF